MKYFSGFCLNSEAAIFDEFIGQYKSNPYIVEGFSYGAIKALEYLFKSEKRCDRLILLSPSFFLGRSRSFIKTQRLYFKKDPAAYIEKFIANAAYPAEKKVLEPFLTPGTYEELEELLEYEWPEYKLESVAGRGTKIEIYLGAEDKIIDAAEAHKFFKNFGESYLFKRHGHILCEGENNG